MTFQAVNKPGAMWKCCLRREWRVQYSDCLQHGLPVVRESHLLEVVAGLRSCDGQPGDEGRRAVNNTWMREDGALPWWMTAPT